MPGDILYFEDDPVSALLVHELLRQLEDVTLRVSDTAKEGLLLIREKRPDLVLLDLHLRDALGLDVLRALRADTDTRSLRVIILSASAMAEEIHLAMKEGADGFWTKPLDVPLFCEAVTVALSPEPLPLRFRNLLHHR